jgi:hypothetical protein
MRRDGLRTLLVVSDRPHPWAFLRDRLPPDLVRVAWTRPDGTPEPAPWMVAGTGSGPAPALRGLRGRLFGCRWVGPAPADLPARPVAREDWRAVAADAERGLAARLAGLRLAPGAGLVLPDGGFLPGAPDLEALLSAHPDGLAVDRPDRRLRESVRRVRAVLDRQRLPLAVTSAGGLLALVETGGR